MFPILVGTMLALSVLTQPTLSLAIIPQSTQSSVIAEHDYSLSDRYADSYVNNVFADNILLTLAYLRGTAKDGERVDWTKVTQDYEYSMTLQPGETFAFHDQVLPEYAGKVTFTTNAHFNSLEGFKSDGWLVADGVCHLASFMNMVAKNAGLQVVAPTNHDFANIPEVPREYGTAIFYMPGEKTTSSMQNLYITNTFDTPVTFVFTHKGSSLDIKIEK